MSSTLDTLVASAGAFVILAAIVYFGLSVLDVSPAALSSQARALALLVLVGIAVYVGVN